METIEKVLGCLQQLLLLVPIQQLFVRVVPIQQLFPCDHNQQSRGITGLLDMKRDLFAQMGRGTRNTFEELGG